MAYVSKEKKAKVMAALKLAIPKSWKWSLAVDHYSTLVLTIYSAPVDLIEAYIGDRRLRDPDAKITYLDVNHYHYKNYMKGPKIIAIFEKIIAAMNIDNHDRSRIEVDYFDVGHYVSIKLGRWDRPFKVEGK